MNRPRWLWLVAMLVVLASPLAASAEEQLNGSVVSPFRLVADAVVPWVEHVREMAFKRAEAGKVDMEVSYYELAPIDKGFYGYILYDAEVSGGAITSTSHGISHNRPIRMMAAPTAIRDAVPLPASMSCPFLWSRYSKSFEPTWTPARSR